MDEPTSPRPRGKLKVYLGYAAGVGKTYRMLDEGQQLKRDGVDVVVGYFEPHGRKDTIIKAQGLETVPRRKLEYRGARFEEMDSEAVLRRRPQVCLVDEFAHTNVPGSERAKRWQDVQVLLEGGIDVVTTVNVQHLESLNDQVWRASGIRVRETIPDWVIKQADEVVMIDLPPEALLNRLRRGAVYAPERAGQALQNFFKESTLVVLRELALRQTAHEVDMRQVVEEAPEPSPSAQPASPAAPLVREGQPDRILIYITADPLTAVLIRRGKRVADYLQADCFALAVRPDSELDTAPPAEREAIDKHLNFARSLHIETRVLQGDRAAEVLVEFARLHEVTQIFLARPPKKSGLSLLGRDLVQQVVRLARDMQVTIVAERHPDRVAR
ncbi:MAG: histidine kinase [Acidobacteria bacterium]|nr:MAG: histidine kinase [Acidobacteriota bacterium]